MPIIPAAIAIGSAVTATVSAVATGIGVAIGAVAGAVVSYGGAALATIGEVLGGAGIAAVAGSATTATIQSVMQKKAAGEVLEAQEQEALRYYEAEDKARAEREYQAIQAEIRAKEQAEIDRLEKEVQAEQQEQYLMSSTQGQQIETLSNLIAATKTIQASRPKSVPVILTTPSPERPVSWIDNINNTIYGWFN